MSGYIAKSKTDDWSTPKKLYDEFIGYFDPCPLHSIFDGLAIEWKERNFVNPPYSQLKKWIIKAISENKKGREVVLLIPARTDTKAFKMLYEYGCNFCFIVGRLHFNEAGAAPFASVLITLRGDQKNILSYREVDK